jgi:hypothetical protein
LRIQAKNEVKSFYHLILDPLNPRITFFLFDPQSCSAYNQYWSKKTGVDPMPHFGLMDPEALGAEAAALQRARLHIRGGRRRLRQGKISTGLGTLFDALLFAMAWYIADSERRKALPLKNGDDLRDDRTVFARLAEAGVIDGRLDYDSLYGLVEAAPAFSANYDYSESLRRFEALLIQLGVLPFAEDELPPEDPSTY